MCNDQQTLPTGMMRHLSLDGAVYVFDLVHGFAGQAYAVVESSA